MDARDRMHRWQGGAWEDLDGAAQLALLLDVLDCMDEEERSLQDALDTLAARIGKPKNVAPYADSLLAGLAHRKMADGLRAIDCLPKSGWTA